MADIVASSQPCMSREGLEQGAKGEKQTAYRQRCRLRRKWRSEKGKVEGGVGKNNGSR